ncbi:MULTISPECIES: hypothetical protein [Bacillus]|uniref:Uncharacterized protein n=1 Tax=Bacillus pumilus (strain SAFR-032) TaxID=315750 RepID=A8FIN7_BACP2|nr:MULTISPECIES: hypothetical protein [Bacillus]MCP1150558.1 hypothetical protein [Bacillus sp. 1735sda2]ABV64104.1 hypothetical protein BPUM_3454 [Bacillus pumilus SAFR-032]AVI42757.1 hypothetical protein C5Y82_17705 [Bacillus pumilus]MBC3641141.1 hypothetical protein [Bacillus pumilus]MBC3647216.1 hypothetical protein [Bacillus pumilus]
MRKFKNWLSVWFGFMMNVLVNPGVMMKQQRFQAAAVDDRFFQIVKERELEKLAEVKNKKRRSERAFKQSLIMLDEKTTREARAGPLLPLHGR